MTTEEKMLFSNLLFAHRHLWMTFQVQEHPEMDWETANDIFFEESDEVYTSLAEALLEEQPLQDKLQTVLLQSRLTEVEVRNRLKNR